MENRASKINPIRKTTPYTNGKRFSKMTYTAWQVQYNAHTCTHTHTHTHTKCSKIANKTIITFQKQNEKKKLLAESAFRKLLFLKPKFKIKILETRRQK